jgi:hypothetical protein
MTPPTCRPRAIRVALRIETGDERTTWASRRECGTLAAIQVLNS